MIVKAGLPRYVKHLARLDTFQAGAAKVTVEEVAKAVSAVEETSRWLDRNANARLALDNMMLAMPRHPVMFRNRTLTMRCGPYRTLRDDGTTAEAGEIVGVRFIPSGKVYFFAPGNVVVSVGDRVEVETDVGYREGTVVIAPDQVRYADLRGGLDTLVRKIE